MKSIIRCLAALSILAGPAAAGEPAAVRSCLPLLDGAGRRPDSLAVTLAGGGTKASSFAMGVLAALAGTPLAASASPARNSKLALWQTDLISTVSGGSYAGYFLYSRLIHERDTRQGEPAAPLPPGVVAGYFADCIPDNLKQVMAPPAADGGIVAAEARRRGTTPEILFCAPYANAIVDAGGAKLRAASAYWTATRPDTLHQQFVRCHQDVLTWPHCDFGGSDSRERADAWHNLSSGAALTLVTGVSLPFAWTANFLFDWPLNLSPSRVAYRDGIGMAFGLRPRDVRAIQGPTEWAYNVNAIDGATTVRGNLLPDPARLDFARLSELAAGHPDDPPRWVINATAAPSRNLLGWIGQNDVDLERHIFHMTGREQCSGATGPLPIDDRTLWDIEEKDRTLSPLLTAVNASAAFFDSNEQTLGQPWRLLAGFALQTANLNWGIDLRNLDQDHRRRTSPLREKLHEAAPFPLYFAESLAAHAAGLDPVFIRLLDGGASDNLGAWGPIVEGVRDVVVSDHAQDENGSMADLCFLRNELFLRRGLHLHVPGLERWPAGCRDGDILRRSRDGGHDPASAGRRERLAQGDGDGTDRFFYPIWAWPYPFLAGCVSASDDPASCLVQPINRLWIVKPAFDYPHWLRSQTACRADDAAPECPAPDADDANRRLVSCGDNHELPCETAAVLLRGNHYLRHASAFGTPEFPQGSTVKMTFNSNAAVYGAYRELARHYVRQALRAVDRVRADASGEAFARIVCWQAAHPVRGSADPADLRYLPTRGDIRLADWNIGQRDLARRGVGSEDGGDYAEAIPGCRGAMRPAAGR